ncbi:MAG: hypothetical protein WB622_04870 [Acidobacteriaceae bacterium]|jgi:hypothetical protein
MSSLTEYRCEICGNVTTNPMHWFVIECGESQLTVHRWEPELASGPGARHLCGEADAQVYISRWFESLCSPPRPNYSTMPSGGTSAS